MDIKQLTDTLSVAQQIETADLASLAQAGFKTIINNRPDGEVLGQPLSESLAKAAADLGFAYHYMPVTPGHISEGNIHSLQEVLATAPTPALAFCRSGTRSTTLWAYAMADSMPVETIIRLAARAGYDLSALEPTLRSLKAP